MEILPVVKWVSKFIVSFLRKSKKNKTNTIKNQNKRSDFFTYSGVTNKEAAIPIDFLKSVEPKETLPILFSGFNDRFNLFEPIGQYNLNSTPRQKSKDKGDKIYVEKYYSFHSEFIVPFLFDNNESAYDDKESFLKLLTGEKRLIYIVGSVGCGKSTFISHLIYFAKQEINKQKIAIISVSARDLAKKDTDDYERAIYEIIETSFHSDFKQVSIKDSNDFNKVVNKHFKNHKLTIIIDDLDEIYDQSRLLILKTPEHKNAFEEHFKSQKYIHIAVQVFRTIKQLLDDNNNVRFVIGLRDETFESINTKYIRDTGGVSLKKLRNPLCIKVKHLSVSDILDKRFELGRLNDDTNLHNVFHEFSQKFSNEFDGLHINGTRHVMAKIRELAKLDTSQLFYPTWILQLYIYLDGFQKYSQQACGILNIFLVNIDYRKEIDQFDEKWPKFSKEDHYQTFWLKYFICKYFNSIGEMVVDADMVYKKKFSKYEKGIFNFSLYSITDTNHGRLISCCFDKNEIGNQDYKLEKTDRLTYCFDNNIFFSFIYLSVIVNDDYLEIPKIKDPKSQQIIENIFDTKHSYESIFFNKQNLKWKEWLFEHIKKVLVFVKILENSFLHYEKDKITSLENLSPNFTEINKALNEEIMGIAKTIDISEDDINSEIKKINKINNSLDKHLKKHFKKYSKFATKKSNL